MKNAGYALITFSFLVASWTAVQHPTEMDWAWFVPALVAGVVGVGLARAGSRREAQASDKLSSDVEVLEASLDSVVRKIEAFDAQKQSMNPYDAHGRIDELFPDDLNTFVEARETIAHVFGLQAYADVMSEFAAGERYLARVWSASVDGYIDEVREYIGRAREQFETAQQKFRALKA